jgi:hypothetical protein
MTNDELFDIMRPIILTVTGVPEVILANPNAPAPSGPYAAVQPQQVITEQGQANVRRSNVTGQESITVDVRAQIMCECSINFYRGDTRTMAGKLKQSNKRPDVSATLFKNKLGWNRTGPVNNLTALQSNNFESRAQITIFLMYETTDPVVINSIEQVAWEVQNEKAEVLASGNIVSPDAP